MKTLLTAVLIANLNVPVVTADADAVVARTGQYSVSSLVTELTDEETLNSLHEVVSADVEIEWEIYVPENYSAVEPPGVMVNISPTDSGRVQQSWKEVLARNNLIWIGADQSGNKIMTARRILFAALAPGYIQKHYPVNTDRIYISGFSGGGRVSSIVSIEFARLFKGAIYVCGVNPPREERPILLDHIRNNRFVFLTGTKDFNEAETKRVYRAYRELEVPGIKLLVVPHMGHRNPDADRFEEAIQFLDSGIQQ